MIATAPIRCASAAVQFSAAAAAKDFWERMTKEARVAIPSPQHEEIMAMNGNLAQVILTQESLIALLKDVPDEVMQIPEFADAIRELEGAVSQTDSVVRAMFTSSPGEYLRCLQPQIQKVSELSGHIDNYTEMFRVALNENCSAVLAHLADTILERERA